MNKAPIKGMVRIGDPWRFAKRTHLTLTFEKRWMRSEP